MFIRTKRGRRAYEVAIANHFCDFRTRHHVTNHIWIETPNMIRICSPLLCPVQLWDQNADVWIETPNMIRICSLLLCPVQLWDQNADDMLMT